MWLILVNYLIWEEKFTYTVLFCGYYINYSLSRSSVMIKVSCSYVVRGERGVIFLFSAKRPPRKIELSSYLRRAGQRRCFQRICLADFYRGRPSLRSGSRSLQKNHSPFAPSYGLGYCYELVAPVTRTSMYLLLIAAKMTICTDIT